MLEYRMNEAQVLKKQGKKIKEISKIMNKSKRTIHNYLSENPRTRKDRNYPSKLDPFKDAIKSILELKDDYNYNRELLFEDLKKLGYTGGISILRDYAAKLAAKEAQQVYFRFETIPGFQAQVDWKECGKRNVQGKIKKVYAFTMTLGFSRKPFILHTLWMTESILLACHIEAFKFFGGVPQEILYDNMKTAFVYEQSNGWQVNKQLLRFANHYGFTPKRCRVRRPQTKGKVERTIGYYSSNFLPRIKDMDLSLEELNDKVLEWIENISIKPIRELKESRNYRFEKEKEHLQALPTNDFICDEENSVKVYGNSLFHYKTNRYSVPCRYIGKTLILRVSPWRDKASIYHENDLIRSFELSEEGSYSENYRTEDKTELIKLCEKQRNNEIKRNRRKNEKKAEVNNKIVDPSAYDRYINNEEGAA